MQFYVVAFLITFALGSSVLVADDNQPTNPRDVNSADFVLPPDLQKTRTNDSMSDQNPDVPGAPETPQPPINNEIEGR